MWLFCFVLAYVIVKAWEEGRAQAGAEWRRAREHAAGEFGRRMAAGEVASPWDDPWWWAAAARRAWQSMRGPRAGATSRAALPHATPLRRIAAAAAHGAAQGWANGARRGRERRAERRAARAARGPGRAQRAAGTAGRRAGFFAGYAAGRAGWRRRPRLVALAACDDCGQVCAATSMAYQRREVDGRIETWLLCANCRAAPAPGPGPGAAAPELAAVTASVTTTVTTMTTTTVSAAAVAVASGGEAPAVPASGDFTGITDAEIVDDDPAPATGPDGEPGSVPVAAAFPLPAGDPDQPTAPEPRPGPALPLTGTSTDGGNVSTEIELAGGRVPARAGEAYNYGAWERATATDGEVLDQLGLCLEAMLSDLTAVSAGRTQVQNVTAWADRVRAEADLTRDAIDEMNRRYQPVIATVAAVGGPEEVSNTSYYSQM
jgi:hypothetical protein